MVRSMATSRHRHRATLLLLLHITLLVAEEQARRLATTSDPGFVCNRLTSNFAYATGAPRWQAAVDMLGTWASALPPTFDGERLKSGGAGLFGDDRVQLLLNNFNVTGARVLELGPLEGAHSFMLARAGAASVLAIEGSPLAYLKCLLVAQMYRLSTVQFQFGDFQEGLAQLITQERKFEIGIAVGVLYHMQNPALVLKRMCQLVDTILIWTQLYKDGYKGGECCDQIAPNSEQWHKVRKTMHIGQFSYSPHYHSYANGNNKRLNFLGGMDEGSVWMTEEELEGALQAFGFEVRQKIDGSTVSGYGVTLIAVRAGRRSGVRKQD